MTAPVTVARPAPPRAEVDVSTTVARQPRTLARAGVIVAAGMAAAHAAGYAFNIILSRRLGTAGYGELAALLGVFTVGSVPALAMTAVTARRVATHALHEHATRPLLRVGLLLGAMATAAGALVAYPLFRLLDLSSLWSALWVALALGPFAVTTTVEGMLQGDQRFRSLSTVFVSTSVLRLVGGLVGYSVGGTPSAVLAGTAAASLAAALVAVAFTHHRWTTQGSSVAVGIGTELSHVVVTIGGLLALSNVDVVLARAFLDPHDAGLYAAGSLVVKAVYWAPQFVSVSAYARLTDPVQRARLLPRALLVVAGLGAVAIAGAAVFAEVGLRVVLGPQYAGLASLLWLFAALGALLALAQLLVASGVAVRDRRVTGLVWGAVAVEVGLVATVAHGSLAAVLAAALTAAGGLVVAGLLTRR